MALFESILTLLLLAIVLLQVSRRLDIPYPTMLALAGVGVAALPWAPVIHIDSNLVMTLFIAPAILDAAFDFPARALRQYWVAFIALAVFAVIVTTAAVAWAGVAWMHMPLAAAVALGAIVAPPDAAAAVAILRQVNLPRVTVIILEGESLLNDAVALLIFGIAVAAAMPAASANDPVWTLVVSIPGGLLLGFLIAQVIVRVLPLLAGTLGSILFQFVATYATWLIAHALHFSPILAVVATAMTASTQRKYSPPARDRIHSYSMWGTVVFLLNVLAFLLVGLQAREAISALAAGELWKQVGFALAILGVVIGVRIVWLGICNVMLPVVYRWLGYGDKAGPTLKRSAVGAWCGMRGLVTLAAALALPAEFPARGTILLTALAVVLGTLIVQGLTLAPLIRWLNFDPDDSHAEELANARRALVEASLAHLGERDDEDALLLKRRYLLEHAATKNLDAPFDIALNRLELECVAAQRKHLHSLRSEGSIDEDVFQLLETQLDLAEVRCSPPMDFALKES
jgi:CPA1 family monovalent cation:H+ antiporter